MDVTSLDVIPNFAFFRSPDPAVIVRRLFLTAHHFYLSCSPRTMHRNFAPDPLKPLLRSRFQCQGNLPSPTEFRLGVISWTLKEGAEARFPSAETLVGGRCGVDAWVL